MKNLGTYLTGKNLYSAFLHIALLVLAFEVVLLAKQNREMKNGLRMQRPEVIAVGDPFSMDDLVPLADDFKLEANSRRLFFIFTTTCPYCEKNVENWQEVEKKLEERKKLIVGIALDSLENTQQYASEKRLKFP